MRKYYNILTIQLLTKVHVLIHIGNKGDIHRSSKYCEFKTSKDQLQKIPEKY